MKRVVDRSVFALVLGLLLLVGCTDDVVPRTQVLVQIDGNPGVRARAQQLRVSLASRAAGESEFEEARQERFTIDDSFAWPASLALMPKGGDSKRSFRVFVEALDGERTFVSARVISSFLDEQTLLLEIVLEDGCVEFLGCGEESTCVAPGGAPRCASAKIDPQQLKAIKAPPRKDAGVEPDASEPDASEPDASEVDASEPDASEVDAGELDARVCGAESCFNGADDDCDGLTDCADPDCSAPAECVADGAELVVKVAVGSACPSGYTRTPTQLHQGLDNGACGGCACGTAGPTTCTATVTGYDAPNGCGGNYVPTNSRAISSFSCPTTGATPHLEGLYAALGLGPVVATAGTCPASGTGTPSAATWGSSTTLCYLEAKGGGCSPGDVCVPRRDAVPLCEQTSATSCANGETREVWYSGFSDARSCGACTCAASGASCAGVALNFGNDWTCGTRSVAAGQITCQQSYSAPANLVGTPTRATCTPRAMLVGSATPTGPTNLCCRVSP